jgi:hypothetical protein
LYKEKFLNIFPPFFLHNKQTTIMGEENKKNGRENKTGESKKETR